MTFISEYTLNQNNTIPLYEKKDKLSLLIGKFKPQKDLDKFLASIDELAIDLQQDYTKVHNFLDILNSDIFIKNLSKKDKEIIGNFLFEKLFVNEKNVKQYMMLWYWIVILFKHYGDSIDVEQMRKLSKKKIIAEETPFIISEFFRENNLPDDYWDIILVDIQQEKEKDMASYGISADGLLFLVKNEIIFEKFITFLTDDKNNDIAIELFRQRGTSYIGENEEEKTFIVSLLPKLNQEQKLRFEKLIVAIIDKYFGVHYTNDEKKWHIDEILQSKLFQAILGYLTENNNNFFDDILTNVSKKDRFLHGIINNVIIYSIQPNLVKRFIDHPLAEKRIFLDIYFGLQNTDRKNKKELLSELEKYGNVWLDENEKINENAKNNEKKRLEKENQEVRKEIEDRLTGITSGTVTIDQRLVYLYDKNKESFLEEEKEIIVSQIHTILGDDELFDIKGKARIHYDKENKNSFSRPNYMSYGTIERCYELGKKLGVDVMKYKTKFIHYLPFAYNPKFFDDIVSLNKEEFAYLVEVYSTDRDAEDDLRIFHPFTFFSVLEKLGNELKQDYPDLFSQSITNLKEFLKLDNEKLGLWSKEKILYLFREFVDKEFYTEELVKIIGDSNLEKYNYFNDLLSGNIKSVEDANRYSLWVVVNDILCNRFNDEEAIRRRFKQLQNIKIQIGNLPTGGMYAHGITPLRKEIEGRHRDERRFIDALSEIVYPDYGNEVIKVLKYSFSITKKKVTNLAVSYLQGFVFEYYSKIKNKDKKYDALVLLKNETLSNGDGKSFLSSYFPKILLDFSIDELKLFEIKDKYGSCKKQMIVANEKLSFAKEKIESLSQVIEDKNVKIDELQDKTNGLKKELEQVEEKLLKLEDTEYVIITEGKTDWKLIETCRDYLYKNNKLSNKLNDIIKTSIIHYEIDKTGSSNIHKRITGHLMQFFPNKKFIGIYDSDEKALNDKIINGSRDYHSLKEGLVKKISYNYVAIIIPFPGRKNDKYNSFYNKYGVCIEHYFDDTDLSIFFNPRVHKNRYCNYYYYNSHYWEIKNKLIYDIHDVNEYKKRDNSLKIYDNNDKELSFSERETLVDSITGIMNKETFASNLLDGTRKVNDEKVWNRMKKITNQISKATKLFIT